MTFVWIWQTDLTSQTCDKFTFDKAIRSFWSACPCYQMSSWSWCLSRINQSWSVCLLDQTTGNRSSVTSSIWFGTWNQHQRWQTDLATHNVWRTLFDRTKPKHSWMQWPETHLGSGASSWDFPFGGSCGGHHNQAWNFHIWEDRHLYVAIAKIKTISIMIDESTHALLSKHKIKAQGGANVHVKSRHFLNNLCFF